MNGKHPYHGYGKTRFNRGKPKGACWLDLRDKAIKAGAFTPEPGQP